MGGIWSGRSPMYDTTADFPELSARVVARCSPAALGKLPEGRVLFVRCEAPSTWSTRRVSLHWATSHAPETKREANLLLVSRPQPFGGRRWWWKCPRCDRRRGGLFLAGGWACRRCLRLTYRSQREHEWHRGDRRLRTLALRFGIPPEEAWDWTGSECPDKPKGMHWRTYDRLAEQWDQVYERTNAAGWRMMAGLMR